MEEGSHVQYMMVMYTGGRQWLESPILLPINMDRFAVELWFGYDEPKYWADTVLGLGVWFRII